VLPEARMLLPSFFFTCGLKILISLKLLQIGSASPYRKPCQNRLGNIMSGRDRDVAVQLVAINNPEPQVMHVHSGSV
jgi:hypothetical protein